MTYDVNYFISKFSNTRDDKWCISDLHQQDKSCANGWCGVTHISLNRLTGVIIEIPATIESIGLAVVFKSLSTDKHQDNADHPYYSSIAAEINNGKDERYQQSHPKKRILAALYDIKAMQDKETIGGEPEIKPAVIEHGNNPSYPNISKQLAVLPINETPDLKPQTIHQC